MAVRIAPDARQQFFDNQGNVLNGGLLFTYAAGSSTKLNTYTDSTGAVANANPIQLDADGRTPDGVWLTEGLAYKFVLSPANDTDPPTSPIWTEDNLRGVNDASLTIDQWVSSGLTPTYVSATQFTLAGDQTSTFHVGRRIKTTNTGGTVYSRITVSAYAALTTITVVNDSGVLDSGLSAVSYGLLTATDPSFPAIIDGTGAVTVTYPGGRPTIAVAASTTTVPREIKNLGLTVTINTPANGVTIALKGADGNDPSGTNVVSIGFRNATITNGQSSTVSVVAANSVVISSGSTVGTVAAEPSRIWIGAILVAGAVELAFYQSRSGVNIRPMNENGLISTTAEGGAGAADSAQTWYSATARANVPVTILGCFDSTQATAGTWVTALTSVMVNPSFRPCDRIDIAQDVVTASSTGANTAIPSDNTTPLIGEGDQTNSLSYTARAAANILRHFTRVHGAFTSSGTSLVSTVFKGTANIGTTVQGGEPGANAESEVVGEFDVLAADVSANTYTVRAGWSVGGNTYTFLGVSGARLYGGAASNVHRIEEIAV